MSQDLLVRSEPKSAIPDVAYFIGDMPNKQAVQINENAG
jgi:hypothetical protein